MDRIKATRLYRAGRSVHYDFLIARTYRKYRSFTMNSRSAYADNLRVCMEQAPKEGCVIECGVWRGGTSAGMADVLPGRVHYLFDSFEGLPPADPERDGPEAIAFQRNGTSPYYHNNNTAEESFADTCMKMSGARTYKLVKGWFKDTLRDFTPPEPIGILRLDGDWYDSTMECLTRLYPFVLPNGLVLIDDYYSWDGCTRAVHDFLSQRQLTDRIASRGLAAYIKKSAA
jgi:O-methyltransferase